MLGDGNYVAFNFAAFTPALPPADRQVFYGSFTRDLCDKYLTILPISKLRDRFSIHPWRVCRSRRIHLRFRVLALDLALPVSVCQSPIRLIPFTVGDTTLAINGVPVPVTTGVRFRGH